MAAVPIRYAADPGGAIDKAGDSSKATHAHPLPIDGYRYLSALIVAALHGKPKRGNPEPALHARKRIVGTVALAPPIENVAAGSFRRRQPPEIRGTG